MKPKKSKVTEDSIKAMMKLSKDTSCPVIVYWQDVVGYQNEPVTTYEKAEYLSTLLDFTSTYGIIKAYDSDCIVLVSEESTSSADFTIIPIDLILDIKKLNEI